MDDFGEETKGGEGKSEGESKRGGGRERSSPGVSGRTGQGAAARHGKGRATAGIKADMGSTHRSSSDFPTREHE